MRLREFLEMQKKNQQLNEWKKFARIDSAGNKIILDGNKYFLDNLDIYKKIYGQEEFFRWYYRSFGPSGEQLVFDDNFTMEFGTTLINLYNQTPIVDVFEDGYFYEFMENTEGIKKNGYVYVDNFIEMLFTDYL